MTNPRDQWEPDVIDTEVFEDEYGIIWSSRSANFNKRHDAVTLKRTDYEKLLRAYRRRKK